jgi:hypothetical protein
MNRIPFFLIVLFLCQNILAQTTTSPETLLKQAREELDVLTSQEFAGRGYLKGGHKKAADYLSKRFNQMGLRPAAYDAYGKRSYFQPFEMRINLVREVSVKVGDQELKAGADFIVNRLSGDGDLTDVKVVDCKYGLKAKPSIEGKVVMFRAGLPDKIANDAEKKKAYAEQSQDMYKIQAMMGYRPAAIIIVRSKLTAAFGGEAGPIPIIEMQEDKMPSNLKKISIKIDAGVTTIGTQNVAALLQGKEEPDSVIIVSAHYDHLGTYGDAYFTGANDNASGTVMMLSMAEYFSKNRPKYSMLFIGFGGEECGLKGSQHYVEQDPLIELRKTKFVLNLDLMGNGVDGIMAVCGKDFPELHERLVKLNEELEAVPVVRARPNAPNSDHYFFVLKGVPAFFVFTMGGPTHYHDIYDTAENLEFSKYVEVRELLIRFLETF